jgi:hypothetical protein
VEELTHLFDTFKLFQKFRKARPSFAKSKELRNPFTSKGEFR